MGIHVTKLHKNLICLGILILLDFMSWPCGERTCFAAVRIFESILNHLIPYPWVLSFHAILSTLMLLVHLDWKWNLWRSSVSRNLKNEYLKKYEFFPEKVLKNYLIWFKDLEIPLNMVSECILCVPGFPMTYRTCSNDVSDVF